MSYSNSKVILSLVCLLGAAGAAPCGEPIIKGQDAAFLRDQAKRIVASARLAAGATSGEWRNETPYAVHVPGGNRGYAAYWVRDSVMMLGGDLVSASDVEGWIRLMSSTLRRRDWHVRPGVVVPAYAVPDHINFDGKATFYPGNYERGVKQGGTPWGKYPPLDDDLYFLTAVYEHWKLTGSTELFRSSVRLHSGTMRLDKLCEKVYAARSLDRATSLSVAGNIDTENAKDWGFCDAVFKSGKLLFPSILRYIAATQLSELFTAAGDTGKARNYSEDAARIKRAIPPTFFHPTEQAGEGWLHSATEVGNQPDVWGSAFALWSGAVEGETAKMVGRALVRAFCEGIAVRAGCVRHILSTDTKNKGGWERSVCDLGTYQNGGYWATPTGWYIAAIDQVNPQAASDMAKEYIEFLRNNMRPDGTAEAWEWINPDLDKRVNPLYVASVALPYLSLKKAGLIAE